MSSTVFVDDSGSKEYLTPYTRDFVENPPLFEGNEAFWRGNYFVLCGVRIEDSDLEELNDQFNALKEACFGTRDVEIKSTWMRMSDKRKKFYLDPYGITPEQLNKFGEDYFDLIAANAKKMKLFAVAFDKRWYGPARATADGTPLLKSTQALLERLHSYCGKDCKVVFDQMESSLSIQKGTHDKMQGIFLKNDEMKNIYVTKYDNVSGISFKQSSSENFLQVADICAYTVYRQFTQYGREWDGTHKDDEGKTTLNTYPYFERIRCNFYSGGYFRVGVRGHGLVCIPDKAKINWDFQKDCPA